MWTRTGQVGDLDNQQRLLIVRHTDDLVVAEARTGPPLTLPAMHRTRVSYGAHHSQVGDLWLPGEATGDLPVVVLIHGGFWRAIYTKTLMSRLARAMVERGWAAWNIEYRRVGALGGGGGWPQTFEDVADAIDHMASFSGIDSDRVVTCGHSAGGTLALWAAGRSRLPAGSPGSSVKIAVRAAVSLAGVVDLAAAESSGVGGGAVAGLLGGDEAQVPDHYRLASPSALLPIGVPQVLLHGLGDTVVPASLSEHYVARATDAGDDARYVPLAGVGHREMIDPHGHAWSELTSQLQEIIGP
jgi:acetyl esterase/lipase